VERDVDTTSIWNEPRWKPVIGLMLIIAFSPVLFELWSHVETHPWARTALIFPLLAWVATRTAPRAERLPSSGLIWSVLGVALVLELVAVSGDAPRIGRIGLVAGWVGLVWGAGWAKLVPALLLVWVIPLPSTLMEILSPGLEQGLGWICSALLPGVALGAVGPSPALMGPEEALVVLGSASGGLAMLFGFAGLAWFRAAVQGVTLSTAAIRALGAALLGLPLQAIIVVAAGGLLATGQGEETAQAVLAHAGWILVLLGGLCLVAPLLGSGARVQPREGAQSC
jgi:hypothetical protein